MAKVSDLLPCSWLLLPRPSALAAAPARPPHTLDDNIRKNKKSCCDDTSCTNTIMRINFVMFVGFSHILITVGMKRASFTIFIINILNYSLYSLPLLEEVVQMTLVHQVNCPPERKGHSDQPNLYVCFCMKKEQHQKSHLTFPKGERRA